MPEPEMMIPVAKPWMDEAEVSAARRPILSGWVTQGPEVLGFEQEFAQYVGSQHACAVSSCTTALHIALLAIGVKPGDEVITVSHSFIASANSIRYCGATPVFVDIQPETFNVDPNLISRAITERTRAILCVHQLGMPCDIASVLEIARRYSLPVIEDAACATGSQILVGDKWENVGRPLADIACFSFHPRKVITTGDGGMLTTNHSELDRKFRLLRQHGMSVPDTTRHTSQQVIFESYDVVGYNYRMTDIQAAIGREQLKRLPEILERRREMAVRYMEMLADVPGIKPPFEPAWARSNWQSYCVWIPERCDQRSVMQSMLRDRVATRRGVMCVHREASYPRGTWSCGLEEEPEHSEGHCSRLACSEQAQEHSIVLPLFHQMTEKDQHRVVASLRKACSAN